MDLGTPIEAYGKADITGLREKMLTLPDSFWHCDRYNRASLAANRPGDAVFFFNDIPTCVNRNILRESGSGFVNVLRYAHRPLFDEVTALIERDIAPFFPDCDMMRVQLAELPPGEVIEPHRDVGILTQVHRLHVPLVTHKSVKFIIQRQPFFLEEGRLYDLNNAVMHSVFNNSHVMRVHLLVDMLPHSVARARYHETEEAMIAAVQESRATLEQSDGPGFRRRIGMETSPRP